MIILFRPNESPTADWIEAELKNLSLAYTCQIINDHQTKENDVSPYITDGQRVIRGISELEAYILELTELVAEWCWFASDTCYLNDDGNVC